MRPSSLNGAHAGKNVDGFDEDVFRIKLLAQLRPSGHRRQSCFQEIIEPASHIMRFDHILRGVQRCLEITAPRLCLAAQLDLDPENRPSGEHALFGDSGVAANGAGLFESPDTLQAPTGGKIHLAREGLILNAGICLQASKQFEIDRVEARTIRRVKRRVAPPLHHALTPLELPHSGCVTAAMSPFSLRSGSPGPTLQRRPLSVESFFNATRLSSLGGGAGIPGRDPRAIARAANGVEGRVPL